MKKSFWCTRILSWILALLMTAGLVCLPQKALAATVYDDFPLLPNNLLSGKVIVLDPGHSDTTGPAYGNYVEGYYNRLLAEAVAENLRNCGATVHFTREGSGGMDNCVRMAKVNKIAMDRLLTARKQELSTLKAGTEEYQAKQAQIQEIQRLSNLMGKILEQPKLVETYFNTPYDYGRTRKIHPDLKRIFELENDPVIYENMLMVSLHTNAPGSSSNTTANGASSYRITNTHWETANYYQEYTNGEDNLRLCTTLLKHVCASTGFKNNGVIINDLFMVRETNIPVALLENGYHTNAKDRAVMVNQQSREKLASGIAIGIIEFFGKTYDRAAILEQNTGTAMGSYRIVNGCLVVKGEGLKTEKLLKNLDDPQAVLKDAAGEVKDGEAAVATGDSIILSDGKKYPVALTGDVNKDGKITLLDLLMIQKYLLGTGEFTTVQKEAGDINRDLKTALVDLLLVQKHLLGTQKIR